jgi:hypothetical protein
MDIPEPHVEFCRAVARLARDHKLYRFTGQFRPGYDDAWHGDITFSWESGRHGEDEGKIAIQSQVWVNTNVDLKKSPRHD